MLAMASAAGALVMQLLEAWLRRLCALRAVDRRAGRTWGGREWNGASPGGTGEGWDMGGVGLGLGRKGKGARAGWEDGLREARWNTVQQRLNAVLINVCIDQ